MELFNGQANCAACHPAPQSTDFTYDNIGTPSPSPHPTIGAGS
jgi:cytochrome c peroxidase